MCLQNKEAFLTKTLMGSFSANQPLPQHSRDFWDTKGKQNSFSGHTY